MCTTCCVWRKQLCTHRQLYQSNKGSFPGQTEHRPLQQLWFSLKSYVLVYPQKIHSTQSRKVQKILKVWKLKLEFLLPLCILMPGLFPYKEKIVTILCYFLSCFYNNSCCNQPGIKPQQFYSYNKSKVYCQLMFHLLAR